MIGIGRVGIATAGFLLAAAALPAAAHPHVLIESRVVLRIEGDRLVGFDVEWAFDDIFSADLIQRFDKNRNRRFEPAEIAQLENNAFANLKKYDYFAHVRVGRRKIGIARVAGFTATLDKGSAVYRFSLYLAAPIELGRDPIRAGFYDDEYYVDVAFADAKPFDAAQLPARCAARRRADAENKIYFGMVEPEILEITCKPS